MSFLSSFPIRSPSPSIVEIRSLWLSKKAEEEAALIAHCKTLICAKLPEMFDSNFKVLTNLQQPCGNFFESYEMEDGDRIFSDLAAAPGFVRFQIAEWLKDSILNYVVYAQA